MTREYRNSQIAENKVRFSEALSEFGSTTIYLRKMGLKYDTAELTKLVAERWEIRQDLLEDFNAGLDTVDQVAELQFLNDNPEYLTA